MAEKYVVKREIGNTPTNVYYSFTHEHSWREWFSEIAWVQPREGGRLALNWQGQLNRDLFILGQFNKLDVDKRVEMDWNVNLDPSSGNVVVELEPTDGGTKLALTHTFPEGATSESITRQKKLWDDALENLQSTLETGIDLRLARRPMLGIIVGQLDEAAQARLGVPNRDGTLVEDTIEGLGARAAGFIKNDVMVALDGTELSPAFGIFDFMAHKKAGDTVKVDYYRSGERHTVDMTLSPRQLGDVPATAQELAQQVRGIYDEMETELDAALADISEEAASAPAPDGGWSVKAIMAHLVIGERDQQAFIAAHLSDDVPVNQLQNQNARVYALVAVCPTLAELRSELSKAYRENIAFIENLPDAFVARRSGYWSMAQGMLFAGYHLHDHAGQIREAIGEKAAAA